MSYLVRMWPKIIKVPDKDCEVKLEYADGTTSLFVKVGNLNQASEAQSGQWNAVRTQKQAELVGQWPAPSYASHVEKHAEKVCMTITLPDYDLKVRLLYEDGTQADSVYIQDLQPAAKEQWLAAYVKVLG